MSVTLQEVFEGAGYDFENLEDLKRVRGLLYEAEDLTEEVDEKIDRIENWREEKAEFDAECARDIEWREEHDLM